MFDYPIKRPYPWNFTTPLILVASTFVLVVLILLNLATVGLTSTPFFSPTFVTSEDPSMLDRMNLKKALGRTLECDPTTLVSGGEYRTQNAVFTYTVESITSTDTEEELYTLSYDGSPIENCTIMRVDAIADYNAVKVEAQATINCTLPGNIILIAGFNQVFDNLIPAPGQSRAVRAGVFQSPGHAGMARSLKPRARAQTNAQYMARTAGQLVEILTRDVSNDFRAIVRAYSDKSTLCPLVGKWSSIEDTPTSNCTTASANATIVVERRLNNFVQVLWSATLFDLGVSSPNNRLTDPELMRKSLETNFDKFGTTSVTWPSSHGVDQVVANMTGYGLPLEAPQPVSLNARYICRRMVWKKPANLAVDVLVATASLFMAYWGILNFVLSFFATHLSENAHATRNEYHIRMEHSAQ
ncbi:hypothetical protein BDV93DRAFT_573022 [Ceratobasidium sp. AG-I]|nr:hypothetical protein BDV93DRAFT_573022 [Ceratobasidium sp. AG-I]